ncbi:hypothetical protein ACQEPB_13690 [Novosphingobium fluoreni]|uniref:hypothetical protein n=1 Tax=Novosphingobium fluoreni TaxID=1391222 RepID=UPI003DA03FDF
MMKFAMLLGAALMIAPGTTQAAVTVTDYAFTNEFVLGAYPTLSGTFSISHDSDSGVYALTAQRSQKRALATNMRLAF